MALGSTISQVTESGIKPGIIWPSIQTSGIITATNFKTGTSNVHSTGIEVAGINVNGGDVNIGSGATVYDDGSIRSTGIVTASSFFGNVTGNIAGNISGLRTLGTGVTVTAAGVVSATSYYGNVTGDVTGDVTGNLTGAATQLSTNATGANLTLSGNLGVGGTITYEDVARVDATGISTFREGFGVGPLAGIALTAYKDGSIRTSGIVTASSFVGSGANLTGITQTTINTNADNRIITGSGTANTLNGESGLTFDGTRFSVGIATPTAYYADRFVIQSADEDGITIKAANNTLGANENNYIMFASTDSGAGRYDGYVRYGHSSHSFLVSVNNGGGSGKNFTFESDGDFNIGDGNVVVAAGHGIDFSAQTVGSASGVSVTSEILDHYEEGTWTPDFRGYHHGNASWQSWTMTTAGTRTGYYVRVGQMVSCWAKFEGFQAATGLSYVSVMGLPYISNVASMGFGCCGFADCFDQTNGHPAGTVSAGGYFNVIAVSPNQTNNMILNTSSNRTLFCGFNYRTTG